MKPIKDLVEKLLPYEEKCMNPEDIHKIDQAMAAMGEFLPKLWWSIYQGCIDQGFTKDQAFSILIQYMKSTGVPGPGANT